MARYYDDNFGYWDEPGSGDDFFEREAFRKHVARVSVEKVCRGCGHFVCIMPHYAYCDSCATKRERGGEV